MKYFDEVLKYVNELSNTMDLDSTRVRAEALFYRFKRMVEEADRKKVKGGGMDMGLPELRQRKADTTPTPTSPPPPTPASASGRDSRGRRVGRGGGTSGSGSGSGTNAETPLLKGMSSGPEISDELRALLSREVIKVKVDQN